MAGIIETAESADVPRMRTVFFGTPELAVPCLERLAAAHDVIAVVCQPDKPKGRSGTPAPPPVKECAESLGILVHQPSKLNDGSFASWLRAQAPEICAVAAYGRLLKQPLLDIPPRGWLNMHPSLLPRHRGPSPIQSAVLAGEAETGVSIMRLILEMDAGDILLQESTPIGLDETHVELSGRLAALGARLLVTGFALEALGKAVYTPQNGAEATYCAMFSKEDGRIAWARPAVEIHRLIRAAVPWPVAHCLYEGQVCRIHRATVREVAAGGAPGEVVAVERDRIHVATGADQLTILEFQAPGKKLMPMADFLRGHPIAPGARFEDIR